MTPLPGTPATQRPGSADYVSQRLDGHDRQFREITPAIMAAVGPAISDLQTQQATLTTTVADLATTQADLADVVAQLVKPASFYDHQTGFAVANTYATKASVTLTTPAGFTQAIVSATAHIRVLNNSGGAASFSLTSSINGTAGPVITDDPANGQYGNAAVTYSALVTGLTDGSTFTVATRTYSSPALTSDSGNEATCNGTVLWFR